ncbi:MAG: Maf family protein [bacterium]|nr:Maf family protein [bacterium]
MEFFLASASPQRRELLEGIGIDFTVEPSTIDEAMCTASDPVQRAIALAKLKAEDVHSRHPDVWVLGSDTLVVSNSGELLEKPTDASDAERMLRAHSGNTSQVHSSICLLGPEEQVLEDISSSSVTFKELSDEDIAWWISTNQWQDRSGGFQIDGLGQMMIENLEGDWTGVVGLPVFALGGLLKKAGLRN